MKRLFILLFALLLIAGVMIITQTDSVFAQDDDGATTEDMEFAENWCFRADRWLGQCDHPDFWLTGWYYICGYYMAQVEAGIWPKGPEGQLVADGCLVDLPPPPPPPAPDVEEAESFLCPALNPTGTGGSLPNGNEGDVVKEIGGQGAIYQCFKSRGWVEF